MLVRCSTETSPEVECATEEEIDEFFEHGFSYFGVHTVETYLDMNEIDQPFK